MQTRLVTHLIASILHTTFSATYSSIREIIFNYLCQHCSLGELFFLSYVKDFFFSKIFLVNVKSQKTVAPRFARRLVAVVSETYRTKLFHWSVLLSLSTCREHRHFVSCELTNVTRFCCS